MIKPAPLLLVSYRFVWSEEAECVYFFSVTCQISKLHEQLFEKKKWSAIEPVFSGTVLLSGRFSKSSTCTEGSLKGDHSNKLRIICQCIFIHVYLRNQCQKYLWASILYIKSSWRKMAFFIVLYKTPLLRNWSTCIKRSLCNSSLNTNPTVFPIWEGFVTWYLRVWAHQVQALP